MTRVRRTPWSTTTGPHGICADPACDWQRLTGGSEVETTALYRAARAHAAATGHAVQIERRQFCTVAPTIDVAEALMRRAGARGQKDPSS